MLRGTIFAAVCALVGCSNDGELAEAKAWSTLQGVEVAHREERNSESFLIVRNALDSGFDVVGLHTESKTYPFVWIILSDGTEKVKALPRDVEFKVNCSSLQGIKEIASKPVYAYLTQKCV